MQVSRDYHKRVGSKLYGSVLFCGLSKGHLVKLLTDKWNLAGLGQMKRFILFYKSTEIKNQVEYSSAN